jgi:hypothetical protein
MKTEEQFEPAPNSAETLAPASQWDCFGDTILPGEPLILNRYYLDLDVVLEEANGPKTD